jgi:uncharacterized protein (TIGR03000 family)
MSRRSVLSLLSVLLAVCGATGPAEIPADSHVRDLLQSRLNTARQGYLEAEKAFQARNGSWERLARWSERWLQAQLALSGYPINESPFREAHLGRLRQAEDRLTAWHSKGQASLAEVLEARFQRLQVEIDLTKAKPTTQREAFYPTEDSRAPSPTRLVTAKTTATIAVILPAGAELRFDGVRTKQTGSYREFSVTDLVPDQTYTYRISARWNEGGNVIERDRYVSFHAGDRPEVNFLLPPPQPLAMPPARRSNP